jgi:hypothetical protein
VPDTARQHTSSRPPARVNILFTQVAVTGPTPREFMRDFWLYAAGA